ncbi:hypothetical protein ACFVZH_16605 [Streptomyces sp. NPDC059534]|uniref:hypothetical protein n=1 Tax=Streptomyces sp. NPDC059534 TaxID=3346859 RepID=UPI00368F48D9
MMRRTAASPAFEESAFFAADEPVFAGRRTLIPDVPVPVFGQRDAWPGDCLRRPVNRARSQWKLVFPASPVWNLRAREVSFAMMNTTHSALRKAGIFLPAEQWQLGTVRIVSDSINVLGRWAAKEGMPHDLNAWSTDDWQGFLDDQLEEVEASTAVKYVSVIRRLHQFAALMTGGGLAEDPWPGKSDSEVAEWSPSEIVKTPAVAPATWWPLLRAAWAYIDQFAPQILDRRDEWAESEARATRSERPTGQGNDALLEEWLADSRNLVPVHQASYRGQAAGTPIWATLSLAVTDGRTAHLFNATSAGNRSRSAIRREMVFRVVESGRTVAVLGSRGASALGVKAAPRRYTPRSQEEIDAVLRAWFDDPSHLVPVRSPKAPADGPGEPAWTSLARSVFGPDAVVSVFNGHTRACLRRREWAREAVAAGRFQEEDHGELGRQLRMVRAACYIFTAALTMMRDSEIQEIERGGLAQHYGSPAVTSRKIKRNASQSEFRWWITEPVAKAIAVAERLSWHDTHVFASLSSADSRGGPGIDAARDIDFFIENVNRRRHVTGLEEIPAQVVRPHMFRRTMAIIASQQPDGEIAIGIQLKHAARRALANRVTAAYGAIDAQWAKEFDNQLELAAAKQLVDVLKARRRGEQVAIGPGASRFHAGLDKVITDLDAPQFQGQVADERLEVSLLRDAFADLHLGTINHCLWKASTAECQNQLPPEQRGQAPLIGACQPAKCRNSVLTRKHAPYWIAEEGDLMETLKREKLSPPRRELIRARLAEVQSVTNRFKDQEVSI